MKKILIVEDNADNLDMLSRRLQRAGFEVVSATDGIQGLEAARAHAPDLVLMDMSLPELDGREATRRLKADPATRAIRVVALTAHAMVEDRARALAAGCDDFDEARGPAAPPREDPRAHRRGRPCLSGPPGSSSSTTTR